MIVCGVLLLVSLGGYAYLSGLLDRVDRTPVTGNPSLQDEDLVHPDDQVDETDSADGIEGAAADYQAASLIAIPQDTAVRNILLIGTDMREGEKTGRSDAMIILSINARSKTIHLTSLMRAMYVAIPGKDWSMLNHAFAWGGSDLLLQTIENNLRIKIDDYLVINFAGFTEAIDQVGGVEIELTAKEATYLNSDLGTTRWQAGLRRLDGAAALAYARIRKLDSDFVRTSRQRAVLESLLQQSRTLSPAQMNNLAESLLPLVRTNLTRNELLALVVDGLQARHYPVSQLMLPEAEYRERIYVRKMEMYRFDYQKTISRLHAFIYGD
jgi:LCP family protein required for cell wall assembly